MIDLDDAAAMRAADPSGMLGLVLGLADHCREGYELGSAAEGLPSADDLTAVAFCGMGGSAVAGDVVRALYSARLHLPITVIRTPELPAWCGPHSLVIVSSYSGDTAETLALFEEAVARGSRMIAVTSGGQLALRATELAVGTVSVPASFMPRAAVGYLALGALGALESVGLLPSVAADLDETLGELRRILEVNGPAVPASNNPAKTLALRIGERFPVVWGAEGLGATAAYRWKTQFNENAKVPAFWGALPELDHNEVVGWAEGAGRSFFLVALRHDGEHEEVAARFPLSIEIARSSGMEAEEIRASGVSGLSRLLELFQHGDLVTSYHAIAHGVDPTPIDAIARLKRALAEA